MYDIDSLVERKKIPAAKLTHAIGFIKMQIKIDDYGLVGYTCKLYNGI